MSLKQNIVQKYSPCIHFTVLCVSGEKVDTLILNNLLTYSVLYKGLLPEFNFDY